MKFNKLWKTKDEVKSALEKYFDEEKAQAERNASITRQIIQLDLRQYKIDLKEQLKQLEQQVGEMQARWDASQALATNTVIAEKDKVIQSLQTVIQNMSYHR